MRQLFGFLLIEFLTISSATSQGVSVSNYDYNGQVTTLVPFKFDMYGLPMFANGKLGSSAIFGAPKGIAINKKGVFYLSDHNQIRQIGLDNSVSAFAGTGKRGFKDGTSNEAEFRDPTQLVLDNESNIYVLDSKEGNGNCIRKISQKGDVTTFFTSKIENPSPAIAAMKLKAIKNFTINEQGELFITYTNADCIFKLSITKEISVYGGSGKSGTNDGNLIDASMKNPSWMVWDQKANLFFIDNNKRSLRKVTPEGKIITVAKLEEMNCIAIDKNDNVVISKGNINIGNNSVYLLEAGKKSPKTPLSTFDLRLLAGGSNPKHTNPTGTWYGGFQDGFGEQVLFENPSDISIDPQGNLYLIDASGIRSVRVSSSVEKTIVKKEVVDTYSGNIVLTSKIIAGGGSSRGIKFGSHFSDGYVEKAAFGENIQGLAIDKDNNIFVADPRNHIIRKIAPDGNVTTFAGKLKTAKGLLKGITPEEGYLDGPLLESAFSAPIGIAIDSKNNLFITDMGDHRIRKISPQGMVTTFAGKGPINGNKGGYKDGVGTEAIFCSPEGIAIDSKDNLFIADAGNARIRKITPEGVVSTFCGSGDECKNTLGFKTGNATNAKFYRPVAITVGRNDMLYVSDANSNRIFKIDNNGNMTLLAGSGSQDALLIGENLADGPGSNAMFAFPQGIVADKFGNVYVADYANHKIRKINEQGVVSSIYGYSRKETKDELLQFTVVPQALTINNNGELIYGDDNNNTINKLIKK